MLRFLLLLASAAGAAAVPRWKPPSGYRDVADYCERNLSSLSANEVAYFDSLYDSTPRGLTPYQLVGNNAVCTPGCLIVQRGHVATDAEQSAAFAGKCFGITAADSQANCGQGLSCSLTTSKLLSITPIQASGVVRGSRDGSNWEFFYPPESDGAQIYSLLEGTGSTAQYYKAVGASSYKQFIDQFRRVGSQPFWLGRVSVMQPDGTVKLQRRFFFALQ